MYFMQMKPHNKISGSLDFTNTGSVGVRSSNLLCSTWLEALIYKVSSHFLLPEFLDTISILKFEKCLNTLKYKGYSDQHFSTFWVRILVISEESWFTLSS